MAVSLDLPVVPATALGDRFVVSASSRDVKLDQLKSMVATLDLNKLEAMKDVGVKK